MGGRDELDINFIKRQKELIIFLEARTTYMEAYSLLQFLEPMIDESQVQVVFMEMSRVDYLDSTAIGTLFKLNSLLNKAEGTLYLCNVPDKIQEILDNMHLAHLFPRLTVEDLVEMRDKALDHVPTANRDELSKQFLLDVHQGMIDAAPELKKQFEDLFAVILHELESSRS